MLDQDTRTLDPIFPEPFTQTCSITSFPEQTVRASGNSRTISLSDSETWDLRERRPLSSMNLASECELRGWGGCSNTQARPGSFSSKEDSMLGASPSFRFKTSA